MSESLDIAVVGISASVAGEGGLRDYWRALLGAAGTPRTAVEGGDDARVPARHDATTRTLVSLTREACEDAGRDFPTRAGRLGLVFGPAASAAEASGVGGGSAPPEHRVADALGLPPEDVLVESPARPLAAARRAAAELRGGRFDTLLVGGLSADGASGCMLVLRRLEDARRDGNRVYALLKTLFFFEGARGEEGDFAPALRRAYEGLGIAPRSVALVELSASGATEGVRGEVESLAAAFGERVGLVPWCSLGGGSRAGGVGALLKAALALHHAVLPPAGWGARPPDVRAERTPFYLSETPRPWIHGDGSAPRRAAVQESAPGLRAHAVLEAYSASPEAKMTPGVVWPTELLCFAGEGREGLLALLRQTMHYLDAHPSEPIENLAFTLSRRTAGSHRLAVVARDGADLKGKLGQAAAKLAREERRARWQLRQGVYYGEPRAGATHAGGVALTFPGYGSYYQGMLSDLCMSFPPVRRWFEALNGIFDEECGPLPSQLLYPPPSAAFDEGRRVLERNLHGMRGGAQSGIVSALAVHELLVRLGVRCDVMVGHSNGENAAFVASGAMRFGTRAELLDLIRRFTVHDDRAVSTEHLPKGVFLGVSGLAPEFVGQLISESRGRLHLAMDNCPHQVVLFGGEPVVARAVARITNAGGIAMRLPFDRAYHTPLYKSEEQTIRAVYDHIAFDTPRTPVYSCVTARRLPDDPEAIRALAIEQWSSRVRFRETVETLYDEGVRTFIEVGPNSTLTAFTKDTLRDREHLAVACDSQRVSGLTQLQQLLAQLFVRGDGLDLEYLYSFRDVRAVGLSPDADEPPRAPRPLTESQGAPLFAACGQGRAEVVARTGNGAARMAGAGVVPEAAGAEGVSGEQAGAVLSAAPPSDVSVAPESDVHGAIIRGHFELMRQFLDSQKRTLATLTQSLRVRVDGAAAGAVESAARPEPFDEWPLVGRVVEADAKRLYSERSFTLETDPFLRDHAMGRQPAEPAPRLSPLPVVPFTVSMEIIAEAACRLVGGSASVVGLSNVRGRRWLALDSEPLRLGVSAELGAAGAGGVQDVHVRLFDLGAGVEAHRQLAFEGTVRLAASYPPRPTPIRINHEESATPSLSPEQFYQELLFHGPCFRGVRRLLSCGARALEAELEVPVSRGFFGGRAAPLFRTPAGLLDSAGQLVALWRVEQGERDFGVFPFHAATLEQYAAPPADGRRVVCRALLRQSRGMILEADFDFADERGQVFARLLGFQLRSYGDEYVSRLLRPQTAETYFSEPFGQEETGLICRRVGAETARLLEDGGGIWKRVLAHLILNDSELARWHDLPAGGRRRLEWLAGRAAAKDAVRQWAARALGLVPHHASIEVASDEFGRPFVKCRELESRGATPHVSISHAGGEAVAVADANPVGIDMEHPDARRSTDWARVAFDERDLAGARGDAETLLSLWCAKEAAAKARGTGLGGDPRAWRVEDYSPRPRRVSVAYGGAAGEVTLLREGGAVIAVCRRPGAECRGEGERAPAAAPPPTPSGQAGVDA